MTGKQRGAHCGHQSSLCTSRKLGLREAGQGGRLALGGVRGEAGRKAGKGETARERGSRGEHLQEAEGEWPGECRLSQQRMDLFTSFLYNLKCQVSAHAFYLLELHFAINQDFTAGNLPAMPTDPRTPLLSPTSSLHLPHLLLPCQSLSSWVTPSSSLPSCSC